MTGEFRIAKGWRIFSYITFPLLLALFVFVGFLAVGSDTSNLTTILVLGPVSVGGIILFLYGLIDTIKGRLIIGSNSLSSVSVLGTRTLDLQEIKGFRTNNNYIQIISNNKAKKSISISTYIENSDLVVDWVTTNFTELDRFEAKEEERQILGNDEFGLNAQTRKYKLAEAKRLAKYINIVGGAAGIWLWFYPTPYLISVLAGMTMPAIAIASMYFYRGLIRFDEKKNSAYPSVIYGFLTPSLGLIVRGTMDYEILEYENLWIAVSTATIALLFLAIILTKEFKFKTFVDYVTTLSLGGIILCYFFGSYVMVNCLFDDSEPAIFKSEVLDKEKSTGETTTYYVTLKPWGPRIKTERVSVTKDEFEAIHKGDTVDIFLRTGLLKTPWFYVSQR